jgi:glycosyltransferase involved in cell wall biosynthesis
VPVLAADLAGMREIVDDGRNGFLFRAGDACDLAQVLARVLADGDGRARVAAAARHDMRERFAWDTVAARLLEVYRRAAGTRTP